ncbi:MULTISPECIES: WG repeat-containing protein [unclassified Bradyrhizobium]
MSSSPRPSCRFSKAKCGYVDDAGRPVIAAEFDWVDGFAGPSARVKVAGLYGLINRKGLAVVPPIWDYIAPLDHGRALALKDRHWGVVGEGGEVLPPRYSGIVPMSGAIFAVSISEADPPPVDQVTLEREERLPGPLLPLSGRWGIVSAPASWIVPAAKYREIRRFSRGVSDVIWARSAAKWQLVSFTGLPVTDALYDYLDEGIDDLVIVRTANQWNVVDAAGRQLLPSGTSFVRRRPDGSISYQVGNAEGLVADGGRIVLPARFERIIETRNGYVRAIVAGSEGWYSRTGQPIAMPSDTGATPVPGQADASYRREAGGSVLVCDEEVKAVRRGAVWGYVDARNVTFISPRFRAAGCFERGEAFVVERDGSAWCRIDKSGRIIRAQSCTCQPQSSEKAQFKAGGRLPGCKAPNVGERGGSP